MSRPLILWGATGQARVLAELIEGSDLQLVALIDLNVDDAPFSDAVLLRSEAALDRWISEWSGPVLCGGVAVGGDKGETRLDLQQKLMHRGVELETFVHRTAFRAADSHVGAGSQILANANICAGVRIGSGVIINTAASVDHECWVEDGAHLAPGSRLAGEVRVGRSVFIGTGAIVLPRIEIGDHAVIGAGAVVTRPVPSGRKVVGNPARDIGPSHG